MCWSSPASIDWRQLPVHRGYLAGTRNRPAVAAREHRHHERNWAAHRALAQFEVDLLRERTRTAVAASRARGRVGGSPPALDAIKATAAKPMLPSGTMTASEIARQVEFSASTLYRHVPGGRTAIAESGTSTTA